MGLKRTDEFRKDAVRIALTSGLTRKQVADDLGVGMSTRNKWIRWCPRAWCNLFSGWVLSRSTGRRFLPDP